MVQMNREGSQRLPTEQLARFLMECARQDPALVGRSRPAQPAGAPAHRREVVPKALFPIPLHAGTELTINRQLEDLVSAAVASAQQAEDAFRQAQEANRAAHRRMAVFAGIGVLGILVGLAGIADNHLRGGKALAHSESASVSPDGQAGATVRQAAAPTAAAVSEQQRKPAQGPSIGATAIGATEGAPPPAATQAAAPVVTPPVNRGPVVQAPPWQADTPPVRRVRTGGPGPAQLVAEFQRDVRGLFPGMTQ
jgi:hypothetical protein